MAERELDLVNKVDLRIALADSDAQLESLLGLYLTPLLLKLASPHAQVRQAVFKTIQNVFPRITASRSLQLPIEALLKQVKEPQVPLNADPAQVRLYSLLFLSKGVERLSPAAKSALVPEIIAGISQVSTPVAARLFSLLVKLLEAWKAPERDSPEHETIHDLLFAAEPRDEAYLANTIAKFFMLQPNAGAVPIQAPGLSVTDSSYFTRDAGVSYKTHHEVVTSKNRLLEFMKAGFSDSSLALPILIASTDSSSSVSDRAEMWFRKLTVDLENEDFISTLVDLFVGSPEVPPAKSTLQEKILNLLCRSDIATKSSKVKEISNLGLLSEYAKLRQITVRFIRTVTKQNLTQDDMLDDFNSSIAAKLKASIMAEGWPQLDTSQVTNYRNSISLRLLQYEALGDVLRNSPELWRDDLAFVLFLFDSLEGEAADMKSVLQDVLSGLTVHLPKLPDHTKESLKDILRKYMTDLNHNSNIAACRYLSVKYVNCTYPFSDAEARYLCILGTSKENSSDTIEEANKGLHPYYFNLLQSSNSLDFQSTAEFLGLTSTVRFPSFADIVLTLKEQTASAQENSPIYHCLGEAVRFCLRVLVMQAVEGKSTVIVADEDWISRLDKALEVDEVVRGLVVSEIALLAQMDTSMDGTEVSLNPFHLYIAMIFDALYTQYYGGSLIPTDVIFSSVFTLLVSMAPSSVIGELSTMIPQLLTLINDKVLGAVSVKELCECVGVIATHPVVIDSEVNSTLKSFIANNSPSYSRDARLIAPAFVISRMVLRQRVSSLDPTIIKEYVVSLIENVKDSKLYDSVLEAISQLSTFGAFGPSLKLYDSIEDDIIKLKEAIEPKARACHELSVLALSKFALAFTSTYETTETESLNSIEQLVYNTHISKQIEYIFASGEALLILAGGWQSKNLQQSLDIQGATVEYLPKETGRLEIILKHILSACSNTKPSLRKAGCIWLLSLVQYLSHLPLIKARAAEIHVAFMRFLADRDELIQESASRGLSIVYELGDVELKETLVKGLLRSFTDAKASASLTAGTVELETELFETDVLKTHDGSVSTYKDVLSLASDVGDPSLVYKFMSLAKSNALWSSRRGMAFGLGSILSKSSLDDMLSKNSKMSARLIPKLYRYRFDPNVAVSKSMNDIWSTLIKDTSKTVKENFELILNEILKGMGNKEWRVRQASAAALGDLLQTQPIEQYETRLEEIWNMSFRAMDDIKDSVRKEGTNLSKSLARVLIRTADVTTGKVSTSKATEVLNNLIPFFLGNRGLLSDAKDIREFALETILKLCKIGGKAVKPHVPSLLETFVELMSTLEPEIVNYLVLNADKYNLKSSDVDAKRLQSLGHSPMMDALEQILGLVDEQLMPAVVHALQRSIKRSVGLPSKVCGSRVIVSLITKHYGVAKPYGDKLLSICIGQLSDRNTTITSSYAAAAGYGCKIASLDAVIKYSQTINSLYLESETEESRMLAAVASESVSRYSGLDRFEAISSAFLPLAFIGKHDEAEDVRGVFEREWIESSSGTNAIKLYFSEICELSEAHTKSNNYNVRKIISLSIADLCKSIDVASEKDAVKLFEILLDACKGKSWSGKETVFGALVEFTLRKISFLHEHPDILDQVYKTVLTEGKRRNKEYQRLVVILVGKFINAFPENTEIVESYIEIMDNLLSEEYLEDVELDLGLGKPTKSQEAIAYEEMFLLYISSLFDSISIANLHDGLLQLAFTKMADFKKSGHSLSWRTVSSYNEIFKSLLSRLIERQKTLEDQQLSTISSAFASMFEFGDTGKLERNTIMLARNTKLLLDLLSNHGQLAKADAILLKINGLKTTESSTIVLNELEKATKNY